VRHRRQLGALTADRLRDLGLTEGQRAALLTRPLAIDHLVERGRAAMRAQADRSLARCGADR
jgi:hypothetical protein